mmetsp:Transcript_24993/g.25203  ORF Transcript_24993/g.25203 Transcript_24993/m.25203 type:complete len:433 (-) Transcript_24993:107-1405(-)
MPKEPKPAKSAKTLRHTPLGKELLKPTGKLREPKVHKMSFNDDNNDIGEDSEIIPKKLQSKIQLQAREQRLELSEQELSANDYKNDLTSEDIDEDEDEYNDIDEEEMNEDRDEHDDGIEDLVEFKGDYVEGAGLTEDEEDVVQRFLHAGHAENRSLADIIMDKMREKEMTREYTNRDDEKALPPKVVEVYTSVGKLLKHYTSGKLPKALKMLPHLKNWEEVLWITRPDEWSPIATYTCTRIFVSNLNERMAQRFLNIVLLEKCRDDIRTNKKLNYHLYLALKKGLFKPGAFYKGIILPLALSRSCSLREAAIIGSALVKVSIPANHSAAALLRLAQMPYSGSTSLFIRTLLNKKYALPRRVLDALLAHFSSFTNETRQLPVLWHQSLLVFVQRYKYEFNQNQKEILKELIKTQSHYQISLEIRRELFQTVAL